MLLLPRKVDCAQLSVGRGDEVHTDWPAAAQAAGGGGAGARRGGARAQRRPLEADCFPGANVGVPVAELGGARGLIMAWPRVWGPLIFHTHITSRAHKSARLSFESRPTAGEELRRDERRGPGQKIGSCAGHCLRSVGQGNPAEKPE